jgi:hypothetical protein
MPLLDLKTDLKSLKYGKDRPGGGDSGQPYQKVDINTVDSGFNRFRMTKFDDGLVRGGVVGAANASIVDTLRIGKFLTDFPKGPLFIVKQVGLQLSNPILEHKTNFPTNRPTREQGLLRNVGNFISNTANKILNAVGPTRIYNLGINTLAQVPVNAFGQHIIRHGFLPKRDDSNLYLSVAQYNNNAANNRLTQLTSKFGLGDFQTNPNQDRKLANTLNIINSALGAITKIPIPKININPEQLTINKYYGGPGSIYGLIGNTIIQRYTFTEDASKINPAKNRNYNRQHIPEVRIKKVWDYGISSLSGSILANDDFNLTRGNVNDETPLFNYNVTSYNAFEETKNNQSSSYIAASRKLRDDRLYYVEASKKSSSTLSNTTFPGLTSIENERTTLNDNIVSINDTKNTLDKWDGALTASNDLGLSKQYFSGSIPDIPKPDVTTYSQIVTQNLPISVDGNNNVTSLPSGNKGKIPTRNASYDVYQKIIDSKKLRETTYTLDGNQVNAFGIYGNGFPVKETLGEILPDSTQLPVYTNKDKIVKINIPWNKVTRENRIGSGKQDQINLTPLFENTTGTMGDSVTIGGKFYNINDLVKFRIQSVNYNNPGLGKWMVFRAYITQFSDNTDANWNSVKYAGRGEDFYIYNGFSRKVQIGFKVAALSAEEMQPMYQKLNYLMSNLMPDYNNNLMNGPLVKMTIGNWLDGQDGILNNVSYTIPNDSPWEIAINTVNGVEPLILPHVVEVSMTFTPIGSQTKGINKISEKNSETSHIAQNINDVQYATQFSKIS